MQIQNDFNIQIIFVGHWFFNYLLTNYKSNPINMMRLFFILLFIGFINTVSGQFSVSTGITRQVDALGGNSLFHFYGKNSLELFNGAIIQGDYEHGFFRAYTEVGYFASKFDHELVDEDNFGSSHNSWHSIKTYKSNVFFNMFTFKLGTGAVFNIKSKGKFWNTFSINFFFQLDKFNRIKEKDQVLYESNSSSHYGQFGWQTKYTEYPPNYNEFSILYFESFILQYGNELKFRMGYQNYFFELSGSLGLMNDRRSFNGVYIADIKQFHGPLWNWNTGIKVGYKFNKKTKASISSDALPIIK